MLGLVLLSIAAIWADFAAAGGTVAESKTIVLQRSGVTLTDKTEPPIRCPAPKTMLECAACAVEMYDEERRRRTTGYVTYKCSDTTQWKVTFNRTPMPTPEPEPPVVTPPPAAGKLQVYACADASADGRILENATVTWPNCQGASYRDPSRSLVVATNDDGALYWRLASKVTSGRVWTQAGTAGMWTPVKDIDWGAALVGSITLSWTPPTQNTDGSALTNLAGYRILYGTSPSALVQIIDIKASASIFVVENLTAGTWYFAIRAYNTAGVESANSNIASKNL